MGLARLEMGHEGATVAASEVAIDAGRRWAVHFAVRLDAGWRTRRVIVAVAGDRPGRVELTSDGAGAWRRDGRPAPELAGCLDVDISATPVTNLFAIRRLGLEVGQSADIRAAWIDGGDIAVAPLDQTYTRLEPVGGLAVYEYRDPRFGAFRLTVDAAGVPIDYQGFADRVHPARR